MTRDEIYKSFMDLANADALDVNTVSHQACELVVLAYEEAAQKAEQYLATNDDAYDAKTEIAGSIRSLKDSLAP